MWDNIPINERQTQDICFIVARQYTNYIIGKELPLIMFAGFNYVIVGWHLSFKQNEH